MMNSFRKKLPAISRRKRSEPSKEHEMNEMSRLQWGESSPPVLHGSIPDNSSLRAPPSLIGTELRRDQMIGITNSEVSERYIVKLRKERIRNNKAVFKCLDNLPIRIRPVQSKSNLESSENGDWSKFYFRFYLPSRKSHRGPSHKSMGATPTSSLMSSASLLDCTHSEPNDFCSRCSKNRMKKTNVGFFRHSFSGMDTNLDHGPASASQLDCARSTESFDQLRNNRLGSLFHPIAPYPKYHGFQGHAILTKNPRVRRKHVFGHSLGEDTELQNYKRMPDFDKQMHFIQRSIISGQNIKTKLKKNPQKLPPITCSNDDLTNGGKDAENYAINSVLKCNQQCNSGDDQMHEKDPNKEQRMTNTPINIPVVPMHSFVSDYSDGQDIPFSAPSNTPNVPEKLELRLPVQAMSLGNRNESEGFYSENTMNVLSRTGSSSSAIYQSDNGVKNVEDGKTCSKDKTLENLKHPNKCEGASKKESAENLQTTGWTLNMKTENKDTNLCSNNQNICEKRSNSVSSKGDMGMNSDFSRGGTPKSERKWQNLLAEETEYYRQQSNIDINKDILIKEEKNLEKIISNSEKIFQHNGNSGTSYAEKTKSNSDLPGKQKDQTNVPDLISFDGKNKELSDLRREFGSRQPTMELYKQKDQNFLGNLPDKQQEDKRKAESENSCKHGGNSNKSEPKVSNNDEQHVKEEDNGHILKELTDKKLKNSFSNAEETLVEHKQNDHEHGNLTYSDAFPASEQVSENRAFITAVE